MKTDTTSGLRTRYWTRLDNGRIRCDVCPRGCTLRDGQRGLCFVRSNIDGAIVLTTYGRSSGFCVDPIEKKPLNHFYPGTSVFSFGTAGCNLTCKFCQNWDISKSKATATLAEKASPEEIARTAARAGCKSVAYTYNDPIVFLEYAMDTADACREYGLKSVAVTAGYVHGQAREDFFSKMDAANVDLKAFSERFYKKLCGGHLEPVLETLEYLRRETDVWVELTTLLIPGENDSEQELEQMSQWVVEHLGPEVPWHFSAFHPDWKMTNYPRTPPSTLTRARAIARKNGVRYAYTGNVHDEAGGSTYCHACGTRLIGRDWYEITLWRLTPEGTCPECGTPCAGRFEAQPGTWGPRRRPIRMTWL